MPWFKIDDSSYSHPKFIRAGNAALGLWLRCGAYSAQHLLEGAVPGVIAKSFGTPAQAKKLVAAGLWHTTGHDCSRCPQPDTGDFVIHDFFEGGRNSTRAQVESSRKAATERQAKARARAAEKGKSNDSDVKRDANGAPFDAQLNANGTQNEPHFLGSAAGQEGPSQRDGLTGVTPSHAKPSHNKQAGRGSERVPQWAEPLLDELSRNDIDTNWSRLSTFQWATVQQLINSHGVPYLVHIAKNRWNPNKPIKFASLLIEIWREHRPPAPGSRWRPDTPSQPTAVQLPPHCGHLDCDPESRYRAIEHNGLRAITPCPDCHPQGATA